MAGENEMEPNFDERRVTPVREIMTEPVVVVAPADSLIEAAKSMRKHRVSGLPVVTPGREVVGVVSERDIVLELHRAAGLASARGILDLVLVLDGEGGTERFRQSIGRLRTAQVQDVMSKKAVTIEPQDTLQEGLRLMRQYSVNRLPVVQEGRLVGILTRGDLLAALDRPPGPPPSRNRGAALRTSKKTGAAGDPTG